MAFWDKAGGRLGGGGRKEEGAETFSKDPSSPRPISFRVPVPQLMRSYPCRKEDTEDGIAHLTMPSSEPRSDIGPIPTIPTTTVRVFAVFSLLTPDPISFNVSAYRN